MVKGTSWGRWLPAVLRRRGSGAAARGELGGRLAPAELPPPLWFMAPRDPPGSCRLSSGLGSFCSLYTRSFIYIFYFYFFFSLRAGFELARPFQRQGRAKGLEDGGGGSSAI